MVLVLCTVACSDDSSSVSPGDGGRDSAHGQAGGACFPNNSCYEGLVCQSGVCVVGDGGVRESPVCSQECTAGAAQCVGDQVRLCVTTSTSCAAWSLPQACGGDTPYCSNGICEAQCTEECETAGARRCQGNGYQICGEHDSDSCLDWGPAISCSADELCSPGSGQCVPDCGGAPCACNAGETKVCPDLGECKTGLRQCVDGEFGPCQWQQGPQPEECDGKDNDCDGKMDEPEDLVPPPCEKQAGVCQGAGKPCGGQKQWLSCNDAVYKAHAAASAQAYESSETLCDGLDNDCNGSMDEPDTCCQQSCAGKACGSPDGCGGTCNTGTCPNLQEICQAGTCVCQPSCAGKACGAPDGCGGMCKVGSCGPNQVCNAGVCDCGYLSCEGVCCASGYFCQNKQCTPPPTPTWQVVPSNVTQSLRAIWGFSSSDIWAVGYGGIILHFNGTSWSSFLSGTAEDITGVWGAAANDIWAVSDEDLLHYDGQKWSIDTSFSGWSKKDVFGSSASNIWIVGGIFSYQPKAGVSHFDGISWGWWSTIGDGSQPTAVWSSSPTDVWAVGLDTIYHFDGAWNTQAWTSSVSGWLKGVWGSSATDVWFVGENGILNHYDSTGMKSEAAPSSNTLNGIWGTSASDIWAVGENGTIIHFDGQGWQLSTNGVPNTVWLLDVWGSSASDVWAVGSSGTILHYTGTP